MYLFDLNYCIWATQMVRQGKYLLNKKTSQTALRKTVKCIFDIDLTYSEEENQSIVVE